MIPIKLSLRPENFAPFRFKKFPEGKMLLTSEHGGYAIISEEQFKNLLAGASPESDPELKSKLEAAGIIGFEKAKLATLFAKKHAFLACGPNLHIMVVTLRCNHSCKYCHAAAVPMEAENMDMTLETAKKVVDTAFFSTAPSISIEFQGGEPLVNWEVVKFSIEYAEAKSAKLSKPVRFSLVTNLSIMDDEKLDFLLEHGVGLNTSLDGDEQTHNFNRTFHKGNSFKNVDYWVREIDRRSQEKYWKRNVISALLTTTSKTLKRWKEAVDTYDSLEMDQIFWRPLNAMGFGASTFSFLGYTTEEFIESYGKVLDYMLEKNKAGTSKMKEAYACIFLKKILTPYDPNYVDTRSPCGAVIGQVAYNYDGKIYSCDEGRMLAKMGFDEFQVGEVSDDPRATYVSMITSPSTKAILSASLIEGLPGYENDPYKPYIGACPANNFKSTGDIYPKYPTDFKRRIETGILDAVFTRLQDPENEKIFRKWIAT